MKNIQTIKTYLVKNSYAVVAGQLLFALMFSVFSFGHAAAAGQLTARSLTMSDSGASGGTITTGIGSGTKVVYKLTFTPTSTPIAGIVVDFCSNSAIYLETCTAPTAMSTNRATTAVYNQANLGTGTMAVDTAGTNNVNSIVITRASAAAPSAAASIEIGNGTNGVTNPSAVGTFYARIFTYSTQAGAEAHNPSATTADGTTVDYGAVALSTANVITITARVQESLIFCVSAAAPSTNCSGTSVPAIGIGHGTGTTKVIDSGAIDVGTVYTQISTNAISGATVRMRNSNGSCGGLSSDGGTTCSIPPVNSGISTAPGSPMTAGLAAFGLNVALGTGGTGTVTPIAPYYNAAANTYGMDSTGSVNGNVTTTYGSQVLASGGPVSNVNNTWTFAATASNVTPAGIYTANLSTIATGYF